MSISGDSEKHLIKEFEKILEQEDITAEKLKNYLYSRGENEKPIKDLIISMQEIQTNKRQIHKKLRSIRHEIH